MGDENKIYDNIEYCKVNNINNDEITNDPEIINYKDAIVVPPISNNDSSGVFDIYGNLIIPSALINGKEKKLDHVNPSYSIDVDEDEYPINVKNIYWGGCITNHYGHFIMDVLPRWWAYDEYKKLGYKLGLNIKGETEDKILSLKWLQQFLTILNIEIEDIYIFKIVTKVNNLSIPYPLIMDRTYYHSKLSYFFNKIGEIAEKFVPPHKFTGEYYLSRKNLRAGTRKITNESEIEDIMLRNGIEVLYPEDLTLFEQISIFRRGRVYGFISSAFHNSAFSLNSEGICFSIDKEINRSFSLFDSSSKSKIIYLHIPYEPAEAEYGFFVCVKIKSIGKLESAIVSYRKNELANITSYKNNKSKFHYEHNKNGPFLLENTFGGLAKFVGNEIIFNIKNEDNVFVFIYGDVAFFCSSLDYIVYKNKFFGVDKNKSNDKYSFRDINSDLYVSLDITKIGVILSCDRAQKMDWEEFTLKPCEPNEDYFTYLVNDFLGLGD